MSEFPRNTSTIVPRNYNLKTIVELEIESVESSCFIRGDDSYQEPTFSSYTPRKNDKRRFS